MRRAAFFLITAFWLTMNVLLWKSEFHRDGEPGSVIPVAVVWQKILTAPDDSTLEIFHRKKQLGSCRWSPNIKEAAATGKVSNEQFQPEGMVRQLTGYTIDIMEGRLDLGEGIKRIRFNTGTRFATNHEWREFTLMVGQKPVTLELKADAQTEKLDVSLQAGADGLKQSFTFAELREPEKLLARIGGVLPVEMLAGVLVGEQGFPQWKQLAPELRWEARQDWLKIGHARLRVYRLEARLPGERKIVVIVSRVGEILRVQLPNEIQLLNTSLVNL